MTNEERDIITQFIERVSGSKASSGFGSVPGAAPALPPVDREADALIGDLFSKYPEARYRLTQTAFVQDHALAEAVNRIKRLEWELDQQKQAAAQAMAAAQQQQAEQPRGGGGFFSSIFGGGAARPAPPPQPYQQAPQQGGPWNQGAQPYQGGQPYQGAPPPQYGQGQGGFTQGGQPSMFQRGGSGFLGSALTTAAGVAGGMVVGNALMGMFSPAHAAAAEILPASPAESPWATPDALPEPPMPPPDAAPYVDQSSWSTPDTNVAQNDPGFTDPGNWGSDSGDQSSWSDNSGNQDDTF